MPNPIVRSSPLHRGAGPRDIGIIKLPKERNSRPSRTARSNKQAAQHQARIAKEDRVVFQPTPQQVVGSNHKRRVIVIEQPGDNTPVTTPEESVKPLVNATQPSESSNVVRESEGDTLNIDIDLSDIE